MDNELRDAIVREDAAAVRRLCEEQSYPTATLNAALQLTTDGAIHDELFSHGADDYMGVIRELIRTGHQNAVYNYFVFDQPSNLNPLQVLVWLVGHPLARPEHIELRYRDEVTHVVMIDDIPQLRRYLPISVFGQPDMYRRVVRHAIGEAIEHSSDPEVLEYLLTLSAVEPPVFELLARNPAAFTIAPVLFKYANDHDIDLFGETELVERLLDAHRQDVFVLFYQSYELGFLMDDNGSLLNRAFHTNNHRVISFMLTKRNDMEGLIRALEHTFDPEYQRYHKKVVSELMEETRDLASRDDEDMFEDFRAYNTFFFELILRVTRERPTHQLEQLMAIFKQWIEVIEAQQGNMDPWLDIYELNYDQKERLYENALEAHRVESVIYWIKQGGFTRDVDHPFTYYIEDLQDQMEIWQAIPDQSLREDELLDAPLLKDYMERHQATRLRAYGTLPTDIKRFIDRFI
jgi:hypothetical protein